MQKVRFLVLSLAIVVVGPGCGGVDEGPLGGETPEQQEVLDKPSSREELKTKLNEIAASGVGGSALSGVRPALDELKASDADLAEQLTSDYELLQQATDPQQIKTIAKRMADKL